MFPEKPTCHGSDSIFKTAAGMVWLPPRTEYADRPYRSCGYCGSVHPEDLLKLLADGARLGGSDWKNGWPHKFYIREKDGAPSLNGKFYSEHFLDEGYSPETLAQLADAVEKHGGIRFEVESGRLKYHAPSHGYQAP